MAKVRSPLCLFRVFDLGQDSSYRPPTMGKSMKIHLYILLPLSALAWPVSWE